MKKLINSGRKFPQILALVLIAVSLLLPAQVLAATPTPTPTPTRTPTPTPKPSPTPKAKRYSNRGYGQVRRPSEAFPLVLLEGKLPFCPGWEELPPDVRHDNELPFIYFAGRKGEIGNLCIYGLDPTGSMKVYLSNPKSEDFDPVTLTATDNGLFSNPEAGIEILTLNQTDPPLDGDVGYVNLSSGMAETLLYLWLPAGLPAGEWYIAVSNENDEFAYGSFDLKGLEPLPAIGFTKPHSGPYPASTSPFTRPNSQECLQAVAGDTQTIYVTNLPANTSFEMGVYAENSEVADRVQKINFKTNQKGVGRPDITFKADWQPGVYQVLLPLYDSATKSIWELGPTACFVIN